LDAAEQQELSCTVGHRESAADFGIPVAFSVMQVISVSNRTNRN
jgi:hypothetical protein